MLLEKITQEELDFMQCWYNPLCLTECLFHNFDDLGSFDPEKLGEVRLYQIPFLSYEAIIDIDIDDLTDKEKFKLRKNVGDIYNLGGRLYGKSLITLKIDISLSGLYDDNLWGAFYSIDEKRLRGILDDVKTAFEYHPIFKAWGIHCSFKPEIKFYGRKNKWKLQGVNMTLKGKSPGEQFYQLHVSKLWGDEVSFETEEVFKKRQDSVSELGAIIRLAGMTNFTTHSPIGRIFNDLANKIKIINYPQYVNPKWDEKTKQERLKEYGGETINYRIFVKGEIVPDGISEFDMQRIRQFYNEEEIKRFELNKESYHNFRNLIVIDRPKNADRIFICADIGESAGTDIIILSETKDKYKYLYNIVLYNLTHDEQLEVFKYLIEKLKANIIGVDCGDGTGRAIARELELIYPKENIVKYAGREKIEVDFEKDEKGNIIFQKGLPVYKQEYMSEWSITRLKQLFYEGRCLFPTDYKFDRQLEKVISIRTDMRTKYECIYEGGDHLFSAWRVFAIAQWLKKDFNQTKPIVRKTPGIGVVNWDKKGV